MTFNEYIESKTPLMKSLGVLLDLDVEENHYVLHDLIVHQPEYDYTDCLIRQLPYCYNIEIILKCSDGPSKGEELSFEIEVPKMCEHGFLISDQSTGRVKYRSPILIGELNQKLVYRGNKRKHNRLIRLGYLINIYLDPKIGDYPSISVYEKYGDESPIVNYPLIDYLEHYGIKSSKIPDGIKKDRVKLKKGEYALIGLPEEDVDYYNNKILQLTKVNPKLTKENPYLTPEILFNLIKLALENPLAYEPYTPFDITFMDFSKALFEVDLRRQEYMKNKLSNILMKNGDIGKSLTRSIYKSFSMQTESGSVQVASTSNALSFLSQSRKIYFKKYRDNTKKQMIYSTDFYGLICPTKTPEGVSQTSVKNEVATDVSFDENHNIMIGVITKENFLKGNLTSTNITYGEYYRSRILSIDNVDYRIRKVIPHEGKVKILYLGEFNEVEYTGDECYDYIRQSPEGALSYNAGLIPMANKCDGTRLAMATSMIDQAIPVLGARTSVVKTSVNKLVFDKSNFNIKSPIEGKVVRIVDGYITLEIGKKQYRTFSVPDTINTSMHTCNRFIPCVKVGDNIKVNDPLFISDSFKNNELALTVPLRVAYYSYGMLTGEDAVVISESAAQALSHKLTRHIRIDIPTEANAVFDKKALIDDLTTRKSIDHYKKRLEKLNKFGLPEIGVEYSKINRECIGMYLAVDTNPESANKRVMKLYRQKSKKSANRLYQPVILDLPAEFAEGTVESIRVFYKNSKEVTETYKDLIRYYNNIHDKLIKDITGGYKTEVPEFNIDLPSYGDIDLSIMITISSINKCGISSKITTRYASKGTVADVIPDDQMPRIKDKNGLPIQIMIPPQSTINRKNIAQIYEMNLCLICKMAFDKNVEYINKHKFNKVREVFNKLYLTDKFNDYSDKDLVDFHNTFEDYYSVEVNSIDNLYTQKVMADLCDYFGIDQDGYHLYDPVNRERITLNKVTVGITEIMRLHFIPEAKAKATSDILDAETVVLFGGTIRSDGQKIGEMERWQLGVHGIENPVNNLLSNAGQLTLDENTNIMLLNELRMLGVDYELFRDLGRR